MADAGISAGFGDGTYRPSEPVTRQAMSAFLNRGLGHVWRTGGSTLLNPGLVVMAGNTDTPGVSVRSMTITVPGATSTFSPHQLVHLTGRVTFIASMNSSLGCPCEFTAYISDGTTDFPGQFETFESASGTILKRSMDVDAVFAAPPGVRTFTLNVALTYRETSASLAGFSFDPSSSLTAASYPFGSPNSDPPN
jgi:hypothetical protein